jgi:hypothetical protein
MKILPVEAKLFHVERQTDGQRDMTKLTLAFLNSANAPRTPQLHTQCINVCRVILTINADYFPKQPQLVGLRIGYKLLSL